MSLFKWKKKNNEIVPEENNSEKPPKECGLKIIETNDSYFGIHQMQTEEEILLTRTRNDAKEAKRNLEDLTNWNTSEDVYLAIMQSLKGHDIFLKFQEIIEFYDIDEDERKERERYIKVDDEGIVYCVKNEKGREVEVKGEFIEKGLAIHQENEHEWTIDHVPSANMLTALPTYEQAKRCAQVVGRLINWNEKKVVNLFIEVLDFKTYMGQIKQAVLNDEEIPELTQRLKCKIVFFNFKNEKMDFKRFCKAIDKLMDLHGLDTIKQEVVDMIYKLKGQGRNIGKIKQTRENLHMVFEGPAGTGKTEVARIMSEIFASLGMLEKGHLIEADRAALVGEHIGSTAPKVKEVVESAMGGTLFIDEAYSLAGDDQDFGNEAISTLIKEMEDRRGEFIVILAGYPADMNRLLDKNEGFRSRINNFLHFHDYTPEQISNISKAILTSKGYTLQKEAQDEIKRAVKGLAKQGKVEGNARKARDIAQAIEEELNIRLGKDKNYEIKDTSLVVLEDVKRATDEKAKASDRDELDEVRKESLKKLHALIGLNELKAKANSILNTIMIDNMRYQNGLTSSKTRMHMVYYGPPGTGKTTVARIMGEFLKGAGMLSSGHFVEASRSDLVAGYVGQTATKVKNVIAKAKGGILFIDEAYSLAKGDAFGEEAVDTLIKEMEDHGDNLVVIFAGYKEEIEELMKVNSGLESRIPYHFEFPHYSADELFEMSLLQLKTSNGLIPTKEAEVILKNYIHQEAAKNGGFVEGDGRWIRNLADIVKVNQSNRLAEESMNGVAITIEKLQEVLPNDLQFA